MLNLIGQSLGRYHILEQLGEGGMATVFKAYDTRLEREVAIKVIRTDLFGSAVLTRILQRFEREAKILAKFSHPNIVKMHDYGEHEGSPYLVLEYLPGGTLKERLRGGPLPWEQAVRLLIPMADALAYAHKHGMVHRDVKSANILLTENGNPMLTDFGIGKILESEESMTSLTGTGMGVGTPEYMAPEQWTGTAVPQSDQYALGVVLFELLTGRRPYEAETPAAILLKQANDPLPRPSKFVKDIPPAVEKVLIKSLAKQPADRYKDMSAFGAALEGLVRAPGEGKQPQVKKERPAPKAKPVEVTRDTFEMMSVSRRSLWTVAGISAAVVIVAILAGLFTNPGVKSSPTETPSPEITAPPALLIETRPSPTSPQPTLTPVLEPTAVLEIGSTWTRPTDGMVMMYVPDGSFEMGSNISDDEKPIHTVMLGAYWMDQTEVTNKMYALCVQAGTCQPPKQTKSYSRSSYYGNSEYDDYPVTYVDWNMTKIYCEWTGARLPTEAEWEKAARGTDGRTYPWGEGIDCNLANSDVSCIAGTSKAGNYTSGKSPYGLFDMAGNVWEWVLDWYDANYYSDSPSLNPQGPGNGQNKVLRGGSWVHDGNFTPAGNQGGPWYNYIGDLRSADRGRSTPSVVDFSIGFRCARSAENASTFPTATEVPQSVPSATTPAALSSEITDVKGVQMALVQAGSFIMGSALGNKDEQPAHKVNLPDYYIDVYEVTNEKYKACVDSGICELPKFTYSKSRSVYFTDYPQYPVIFVTWDMAKNYCEWRGNNTRLPTEAEWEKAARGTDGRTFPWGEGTDCNRANFFNDAITRGSRYCTGDTTPVGSYKSGISPYGLYDMAGNVWEWVLDWYAENYYSSLVENVFNPLGPSSGQYHILRGGSFSSDSGVLRSFLRFQYTTQPSDYSNHDAFGFRCARSAP
jgi:serine/threonine-protein kinase